MRYEVVKYCHDDGYHDCQDEKGLYHHIDIMANGDFNEETKGLNGDDYMDFCKGLCGKTIEIDCLQPYISIGIDVEIVNEG